jgi:molecular chaperone GrpE
MPQSASREAPPVSEAVSPVEDADQRTPSKPVTAAPNIPGETNRAPRQVPQAEPVVAAKEQDAEGTHNDETAWRDRALRLQAEMDNFRKRQQRLAQDSIAADRERLLAAFLSVSDDLERALNADGGSVAVLRHGVDLTRQKLARLLEMEGAERIEALGQSFDPTLHEAVGTVPHERAGVEADTVVDVVEAGYLINHRLLRPARVVVAT